MSVQLAILGIYLAIGLGFFMENLSQRDSELYDLIFKYRKNWLACSFIFLWIFVFGIFVCHFWLPLILRKK